MTVTEVGLVATGCPSTGTEGGVPAPELPSRNFDEHTPAESGTTRPRLIIGIRYSRRSLIFIFLDSFPFPVIAPIAEPGLSTSFSAVRPTDHTPTTPAQAYTKSVGIIIGGIPTNI